MWLQIEVTVIPRYFSYQQTLHAPICRYSLGLQSNLAECAIMQSLSCSTHNVMHLAATHTTAVSNVIVRPGLGKVTCSS